MGVKLREENFIKRGPGKNENQLTSLLGQVRGTVVTLKNMLMSNEGTFRIIGHLDLDCFYAQVEQRRLNISSDTPLAVCQWDGIIAVNYAARRYGIRRGCRLNEARRRCPHLYLAHVGLIQVEPSDNSSQVVPDPSKHKACLKRYRDASHEVLNVIREFHGKSFERASIDEVYIELTGRVCQLLYEISNVPEFLWKIAASICLPFRKLHHENCLHHCSELQTSPYDSERPLIRSDLYSFSYNDVDKILHSLRMLYSYATPSSTSLDLEDEVHQKFNHIATALFEPCCGLLREISKNSEVREQVLCVLEPTTDNIIFRKLDALNAEDFLLILSSILVYRTREAIKKATGFTTSVGISKTKFFSKWLSAKYKPDAQTILLNRDIPKLLNKIPLLEVNSLRGKIGHLVASLLPDVRYLSDISTNYTPETLREKLKSEFSDTDFANRLYRLATGLNEEPLRHITQVKSMMSCKTFKNTNRLQDVKHYVHLICKDLSERLDAEFKTTGRVPKNFVVHQSGGFPATSRTRSIAAFFYDIKDQHVAETVLIEKVFLTLSKRFTSNEMFPCNRLGVSAHLNTGQGVLGTKNLLSNIQMMKREVVRKTSQNPETPPIFQPISYEAPMSIKPKLLSRWCRKRKVLASVQRFSRCKHPVIKISE